MGNVFSILCFCGGAETERPDAEDSQSEGFENMDDAVEFYFSHPIYQVETDEFIHQSVPDEL